MASTQELFEMSRKLTVKMSKNESEEMRNRLKVGQNEQNERPASWAMGGNSAGWNGIGMEGPSMEEFHEEEVKT